MEHKDTIRREDDRNVDHYIKHLQAHGLVPRKQGFGTPAHVAGNTNVLGDVARREGLPHIVSQICLSDVYGERKASADSDNSEEQGG